MGMRDADMDVEWAWFFLFFFFSYAYARARWTGVIADLSQAEVVGLGLVSGVDERCG